MLADFVAPSSVRSILGVAIKELPDAVLSDAIHWWNLQADLRSVALTIEADFATAAALADEEDNAAVFVGAVSRFSAYSVAKALIAAMPQLSPRSLTDGKAGFIRHTAAAFDNAMSQLAADYADARANLLAIYATYLPAVEISTPKTRSLFQVSGLDTDPVTGA